MKSITFKKAPDRPWTEHVAECEESVCGRYRITRSKGSRSFTVVYLPKPKDWTSIGVVVSREDAAKWAGEHAALLPTERMAA